MTDEQQSKGPANAAGAELRAAREHSERELDELATALHLDVSLLEAIEADEFEKLGAPVFARGHLRKYAEALGVDPDQAIAQYEAMQDPNELPPVVAPINNRRLGTRFPGWVIGLLVGLAILAVLLFWFVGRSETPSVTPIPLEPAPETETGAEALPDNRPAEPQATLTAAAEQSAPSIQSAVPDLREASQPTAARTVESVAEPRTQDELVIELSAECWIEIRDSNARRLFAGTAATGRVLRFNGVAPFTLVIGNRRAVAIRQNGEPVAIPAAAIRGRTARFRTPSSQTG